MNATASATGRMIRHSGRITDRQRRTAGAKPPAKPCRRFIAAASTAALCRAGRDGSYGSHLEVAELELRVVASDPDPSRLHDQRAVGAVVDRADEQLPVDEQPDRHLTVLGRDRRLDVLPAPHLQAIQTGVFQIVVTGRRQLLADHYRAVASGDADEVELVGALVAQPDVHTVELLRRCAGCDDEPLEP